MVLVLLQPGFFCHLLSGTVVASSDGCCLPIHQGAFRALRPEDLRRISDFLSA